MAGENGERFAAQIGTIVCIYNSEVWPGTTEYILTVKTKC